jgi:hypothetical protein
LLLVKNQIDGRNSGSKYVGKSFGFREALALFGIYVDILTVGTDRYFRPIGIEGEGSDRSNMELVDLRGRHGLRQDGKAVDCHAVVQRRVCVVDVPSCRFGHALNRCTFSRVRTSR